MIKRQFDIRSKVSEVNGYKLEKELGSGTMGAVWLSTHPSLNFPVALKLIDVSGCADDSELISRFLKEARLASSITHSNVLRVYEAGNAGDICWMSLEFCEKGSLEQLLKTRTFSENEKIKFFKQILQALDSAHKKGIIHRDLKPGNLLLDKSDNIKIADMGIAKDVEGSFSQTYSFTIANTGMGTPHYISPEQAMDAKNVDKRADIYSLGCTFFHVFTGAVPFTGKSPMQVIHKHLNAELTWPDKPFVKDKYRKIISKMMAKEPGDRYNSCEEILAELKENTIYEHNEEEVDNVTAEKPNSRKNKKTIIFCAVLSAIIVILLIMLNSLQ